MDAESREAVFTALRARGIKAIKVVAADGSKANGEVRGVRRRVVAALVALVALGVGVVAYISGTRTGAAVAANPANVSPRHQIYGDPAVMERIEQGDFGNALTRRGDQLLAWFAQPGMVMCPQDTTYSLCTDEMGKELLAVHEANVPLSADDTREVRELKQIVNGMREEMREYLANGNGNAYSYWRRLNERLVEERKIYERTRQELETDPSPALRAERNAALRNLGLRTIPAPRK